MHAQGLLCEPLRAPCLLNNDRIAQSRAAVQARFQNFGNNRFGSLASSTSTTKAMLVPGQKENSIVGNDIKLLAPYRSALIVKECGKLCRFPWLLSAEELDGFIACFVDGLIAKQP
jgi:hypothetical protein